MVSHVINHKINIKGRKNRVMKPTSILKGENLKEIKVRAIMWVGKWSLKGIGQGKTPNPFFLFRWPGRCRATQEKKGGSWTGLGRQGSESSLGKGE